ncbi:MAG: type II toxin-antitoxin system PemK/MazF family toxin [Planctomycetes bacterium]|nr:type II toxin-antitoxin system PemK/MazF family toxin [Planctomycetota bacterium]
MARPLKGDVVVVPFPFSDLSKAKRRPALVIAALPGDDVILCQITSQSFGDSSAIPLGEHELQKGKLQQASRIRPNRIFTADHRIILYAIGSLKPEKTQQVIETIIGILRA